ncbi:MAG: CapA family protein [Peptostreptococcales bacterium]
MKDRLKKSLLLLTYGIATMLFIGTACQKEMLNEQNIEDNGAIQVENEEVVLDILAVGDIMTHGPQLSAHYHKATDSYDFKDNYRHVRDIIKSADIALCNIETTFAGEKKGYSSYPRFNTPDTLVDALLYSGFNIGVTANNHSMDTGKEGFLRTLELLRYRRLPALGTHFDDERNYRIIQKSGVKIGLASFTYETEEYNNKKTINGIIIPKELEDNINIFHYGKLEEGFEDMKQIIAAMEESDVDLIIFYIHWGNEYHKKQNRYQEQIASYLAEEGVDIIFGSHPHVVQPIEIITNSKNEETVVFYSLGNFISNQRFELTEDRHTEDGIIGKVVYTLELETGVGRIQEVKAIPTWVNRYYTPAGYQYSILPLPISEELELNQEEFWRANNSYSNTIEIIGSEYID